MSFECPSCGAETPKLIIFTEPKKLGCASCGTPKARPYNVNLGQTVQYYKRRDGGQGKISAGKAWEIEHRTVSKEDGKTVINSKTGKEAQY